MQADLTGADLRAATPGANLMGQAVSSIFAGALEWCQPDEQ